MRDRIFVTALQCNPSIEGDAKLAWNWVIELSKQFDIWVLTHECNHADIELWLALNEEGRSLRFKYAADDGELSASGEWIKWTEAEWVDAMTRCYENCEKIVEDTMSSEHISVYCHITPSNIDCTISEYGAKQTFIWGPVRVMHPLSRSTLSKIQQANLIFCMTEQDFAALPSASQEKAFVIPETMIDGCGGIPRYTTAIHDGLCLITAGDLNDESGLDLLLRAMADAIKTYPNIRLAVLGDGDKREAYEALSVELGLEEEVTFMGNPDQDQYLFLLTQSDVVVNPTTRKENLPLILDGLSLGKPVITLPNEYLSNDNNNGSALIIESDREKEKCLKMTAALLTITDLHLRKTMGEKAHLLARNLMWEYFGNQIIRLIKEAI